MARATLLHATSPDGTRIGVRRSGEGAPLLLVHGTTADHRRWAGISPRLEERVAVYAMDRRGRGMSGDGPAYALEREAEDIAAVLEAIGEPSVVLGHSYGALCALEGALLTDRVHRMILYEPPLPVEPSSFPAGVPERMEALIDQGENEAALEIFFRDLVEMPDHEFQVYRKLPMWPVRVSLASTIPREMASEGAYRFDPARFADLRIPTLLLAGGDSPPLFHRALEAVAEALPHGRVTVMPGEQHVAMDTNPELFLGEVLAFLDPLPSLPD
jgi:pimeloyl-ACP methyl ester carboxylesterase